MNGSYNRHNIHPDLQAAVPSEPAVVYPRNVGNEAQFVNHHCDPTWLLEIKVWEKYFKDIVAFNDLKAGEEVFINYNYEQIEEEYVNR